MDIIGDLDKSISAVWWRWKINWTGSHRYYLEKGCQNIVYSTVHLCETFCCKGKQRNGVVAGGSIWVKREVFFYFWGGTNKFILVCQRERKTEKWLCRRVEELLDRCLWESRTVWDLARCYSKCGQWTNDSLGTACH